MSKDPAKVVAFKNTDMQHFDNIKNHFGDKQYIQRITGSNKLRAEKSSAMRKTHEALAKLGAGKKYGEK